MKARCALIELDAEYGPIFIHAESHLSEGDPFSTSETAVRASRFNANGLPEVDIDGVHEFIGAVVCSTMHATYDVAIQEQLDASEYLSPVDITGGLTIDGTTATVTANVELVDAGYSFDAHQVTLFLYENNVSWCCGYGGTDTWDHTVRMVRSTPVTLTDAAPMQQVQESVTIPGDWNVDELHAAAVYEEIAGGLSIIQATDFTPVPHYFVTSFPVQVRSTPYGNGTALFEGVIRNVAGNADLIDLAVDAGFGWPTDFQIEGDATWYTSATVPLAAGEVKNVTLRVQTDGDVRIGTGNFTAQSQATAQTHTIRPQVFNGSHSILLVDDDGANILEEVFVDAFGAGGYLFDTYVVGNGDFVPSASDLSGYDVVVWHTAYFPSALDAYQISHIQTYLDRGGGLFLSSTGYMTNNSAHPFTAEYLGVETSTGDVGADEAYGVPGDPITDGMVFPELAWPGPSTNRADEIHPTATANTLFTNENGLPVAVRNQTQGGARTVFNTIEVNAFGAGAEPLIHRTVDWILNGSDPAEIDPVAGNVPTPKMLGASPNPFSPSTDIRFRLARNETVSLVLVDAAGREVRTLVDGRLEAGQHVMTWDGKDDFGNSAPNGVYFARMRSESGESQAKIVRVQ